MKTYEATGKSYEEALENGLNALGATISDVDITVLEEGSKGLFGLFGSRPYKLRLTVKQAEDDPLADLFAPKAPVKKAEPKPQPKPIEKKPEPKPEVKAKPIEKKPEPKPEPKPEMKAEPKPEAPRAEAAEQKAEAPKPVQRKAKQPRPQAEHAEGEQGESTEKKPSRSRSRKPQTGRAEHAEKPVQEKKAESASRQLPPKEIKPIEKPVITMLSDEDVAADSAAGKAQAFLKELTALMGVDVEVAVGNDQEGNVFVQMTGDTLGILIGRRGETLDAVQYLTSLKVNKGQDSYTRVTIDTENYRAKREDTLIRLANRMANRAVKTGRKVALEPMNPYERRVIHSALQSNEAVDTHSEGEEPRRHVVITLRK